MKGNKQTGLIIVGITGLFLLSFYLLILEIRFSPNYLKGTNVLLTYLSIALLLCIPCLYFINQSKHDSYDKLRLGLLALLLFVVFVPAYLGWLNKQWSLGTQSLEYRVLKVEPIRASLGIMEQESILPDYYMLFLLSEQGVRRQKVYTLPIVLKKEDKVRVPLERGVLGIRWLHWQKMKKI